MSEEWKAELTQAAGYIPRWFTRPQAITHPRTIPARRRAAQRHQPPKSGMLCVVWAQVPELFEHQARYGPASILILTNIGIMIGIAVMLVLGIFETHIVVKT